MAKKAKTYFTKSPAKINIGLRILSKRKDGFHNIETVFYPLNRICDEIAVTIIPSNRVTIDVKVTGRYRAKELNNKENICYKAVEYFLEEFNIEGNYRFKIIIKKIIPPGAGLGGGSSNAASVLKQIAKYFGIPLTLGKLINPDLNRIALLLGSDVPFFMYGTPAYATGRGEIIKLLPRFKVNYKILVSNPGIHVKTKWAYKQLKFEKSKSKNLNRIQEFNLKNKYLFVNDFEDVVFKKHPVIRRLKQKMFENGAVFASMSGSGSSVYGFFRY